MKFEYFTKVKLVAASVVLMTSSSLLYTNCSGKGFELKDLTEGETNLGSQEPSSVAITFKNAPPALITTDSTSVSYDLTGTNLSSISVKCYLNGVPRSSCESPIQLSALEDMDYTLTIEATNQNNFVLAAGQRSFRVDSQAPVLTINQAPSGQISASSASISFSVTDNFPEAVVYCALDSAAAAVCASPYNMTNLAVGAHSVKLYGQDKAGNKSATQTVSFSVVMGGVPSVTLSQMPAAFTNMNSASFSFSGTSSNSTIASYECSLDNSAFAVCSSPMSYANLAEGNHSFSVRAKDALGQVSSPANFSFAVDLTKPSTPVVSSNLMSPSKSTSLNLTFNSSDSSGIAKYECKLDAGSYVACGSPQAFANLSSANHTFMVRSTDKAGNVSSEGSYSILIDAVIPVLSITSKPDASTPLTSASFAFSASDALSGIQTVECQLDNQMYASCVSPKAYSNLAAGTHTFNLRASDKAGNSATQSYSWTIAGASTPTPTPSATPVDPSDSCPLLTAEQQKYPGAVVKSVTSYGAIGNGVADEYDALQKLAADISGKQFTQRQIVYFPKGTYYINRTLNSRGGGTNKPIAYKGASNFSLIGCTGAVVSVKGDFEMPNDICDPQGCYSSLMQMQAFRMESSSNFKVSGFEINGNVNLMTRQRLDGGRMLAETFSHGIVTAAAKNYEISNLKIHHFAGDGVYVGDNLTVDDTGLYDNVDSSHNARQGMSIIQARNLRIINSTFRDTGLTDGNYPNHAPSAGVDIEPNWGPNEGSSLTENIVFDNCKFLNNMGSQWVGGDNGKMVYNVTIKNSEIVSRPNNNHPYVIIMSLPGGVLENNKINTYDGMVVPSYSEGVGDITKNNMIVRGNTITSSGVGLQVLDVGARVTIENNTFISAHTPTSYGPFPNVEAGTISFVGNKLSYPAANFGSKGVVGVIKTPSFTGNTITTDSTSRSYTIRVSSGTSAANNTIGPNIILSP